MSAAVCMGMAAAAISSLRAETAEDIAAGIVYARGGIARIGNIQTERMTGTILIGDRQGSFVREVMRPNKVRMEITMDGKALIKTYDGSAGWKLDSITGNSQALRLPDAEAKALADEADIDGPFLNFASKGTKIELLDKEMLGPSLVWKMHVTVKSGQTGLYYVESTGHYILLRESIHTEGGQQTTFNTIYKNFRKVEGVLFPFTVVSSTQDGNRMMALQFETIQLNDPINNKDFEKPTGPIQ